MRHSTHALKSSLMLRLVACMVAIVAAMTSWAYDFNANGIYYNIIASSLSAEVTYASSSYNTYSGQVTIPAQVTNAGKTYKVTAVGDNAFRNCTSLTNVALGSNVKRLGKRTFMGCTQLTQVDITAAVSEIDDYAFAQCSGLSTVRMLNDKPLEIGTGAFLKCNSLNNVKWISSDALDGKGGLISLGTNAFSQCTSLASIVLPGPLQFLGTTIFNGCSALNSHRVLQELLPLSTRMPLDGTSTILSSYPTRSSTPITTLTLRHHRRLWLSREAQSIPSMWLFVNP